MRLWKPQTSTDGLILVAELFQGIKLVAAGNRLPILLQNSRHRDPRHRQQTRKTLVLCGPNFDLVALTLPRLPQNGGKHGFFK